MTYRKASYCFLPIEVLTPCRFQPRKHFDQTLLEELAQSIRSAGVLQPIVVRPLSSQNSYEIVAGERRWRAAQLAQLSEVPCLVNDFTDEQAIEATTIENLNRVDLNPIEEARAYQRLVSEFHYGHEEIAAAIGKSRTTITNMLRLLKLDPKVQQYIIEGKITEGHAKALVGLREQLQVELALRTIQQGWSVRRLEQEARIVHPPAERTKADPNISLLERKVADLLGCPVKIGYDPSSHQTKLEIDCYSLDILEGVLEKLRIKID